MRRWATILFLLLPASAQEGGEWQGPGGPWKKPPKELPKPPEEPKAPEEEPPPELPFDDGACGEEEEAPEAPSDPVPEGVDPVQAEFDKAVALQRKGKWVAARRAFRKFLKTHPEHVLAAAGRPRGASTCP
jgi:TolA-binding protein